MKPVTSASIKAFLCRCLGTDVEVAGVLLDFCEFLGLNDRKSDFANCQNGCYNCYTLFFILIKVSTVKDYTVVTRFVNPTKAVTFCNKFVTSCYKILLHPVTAENSIQATVSKICNRSYGNGYQFPHHFLIPKS